jgi:hypothetical protein
MRIVIPSCIIVDVYFELNIMLSATVFVPHVDNTLHTGSQNCISALEASYNQIVSYFLLFFIFHIRMLYHKPRNYAGD